MKYDKQKILQQLQLDLDGAMPNHNAQMALIETWRNEAQGLGYGNEVNGKSKMVSLDIAKTIEGSIPSLVEPFVANDIISLQGKDSESEQKASKVERLLNYQWKYAQSPLELMENTARTLMTDGTIFVKNSWKDDNPISELIDVDSIVLDPSAKHLKDCRFIIERKKISINEIISNSGWYGSHTIESLSPLEATTATEYDKDSNGKDDSFNFEDRLRQLVDVNFYYGSITIGNKLETILAIWSDDFLINIMPTPYPTAWNGNPFSSEVYIRVAGSIYGESVAELLKVNQRINTGLKRSVLNTLDSSTAGQKGSKKGALDPVNLGKFRRGEYFEYQGQSPEIWEGKFAEVPPHILGLEDRMQMENEELSGISRLSGGLDPRALNSNVSATASSLVNSNAERRLLLIARHIGALIEDMMRKWMDLNALMLEQNSVRINGMVEEITNLDVNGNFDLMINISTPSQKQERAQNLSMLLNTLGSNGNIPKSVIMNLVAELSEAMNMHSLSEQLGSLAQQMQQSEQQPKQNDPMQDIAMQLEMAEQQSVIAKNNSRAELDKAKSMESFVDMQNKSYGL